MENHSAFIHLSPELSNALLRAAAALELDPAMDGPARHQRLQALYRAWEAKSKHPATAEFLHLTESLHGLSPKALDKVEALVRAWHAFGMGIVACRFPSGHPLACCPKFLLTWGSRLEPDVPWYAAFSSRHGQHTRRHDPWVQGLRRLFEQTKDESIGWVSSFGTPVYDLSTCWAVLHKKPVLLVAVPSRKQSAIQCAFTYFPGMKPFRLVSCLPGRAGCPPARHMVCRDRLVAALAHHLFVLAVRRHGNLAHVLYDELSYRPKPTWVFPLREGSTPMPGNLHLLEAFPQVVRMWRNDDGLHSPSSPEKIPRSPPMAADRTIMPPPAGTFLFHYTRSCPGPWPGQERCAWAEDLFRATPWADHTALDTLWRILSERRLRACGRLIRGGTPVVSWTSVPPQDLARLTRWNPALIRWTFEPYGIAVRRDVLKKLGAQPVIYAQETDYGKIPEKHRFRFQIHRPGSSSWKVEREWRLPGDLPLDDLPADAWWVFVPTVLEAQSLEREVRHRCRIYTLPTLPKGSESS